jgi:hypothetical protein
VFSARPQATSFALVLLTISESEPSGRNTPPHAGIGFIWNNMREGFGVGHRANLEHFASRAGTGRRQYLVAYIPPKGT